MAKNCVNFICDGIFFSLATAQADSHQVVSEFKYFQAVCRIFKI